MSTPEPPSEFVAEAYAIQGHEDMVDFYRRWAERYDEEMLSKGYCSPRAIAELAHQYLVNADAEVLDAGCGTGLTSVVLADHGYGRLDGVDLSESMLGVAGARGIYRSLFTADLTQTLPVESESYDAVISSGTFTHGHVGPEALTELVRVLRAGGVLACTVHRDLWSSLGFDVAFEDLVNAGHLESLHQALGPYYDDGEDEGWFCVYRRTGD